MISPTRSFALFTALLFFAGGCNSRIDKFADVRDYLFNLTQKEYKTDLEFSLNTNSIGFLKGIDEGIDIDENSLKVEDISQVEVGVYSSARHGGIETNNLASPDRLKSISRRLSRHGYDLVAESRKDGEVTVLVVKEGIKGAAYVVHVADERLVLVKVHAHITKS